MEFTAICISKAKHLLSGAFIELHDDMYLVVDIESRFNNAVMLRVEPADLSIHNPFISTLVHEDLEFRVYRVRT